jgi:hypothetical protein
MDQSDIRTAFNNTEAEIFSHGLDIDIDEPGTGYSGEITDRSLEELEGWDGRPLSLAEHASGNHFDSIDRPLEMEAEQRHAEEVQQRDKRIGELERALSEQRALRDPEREAAQERGRQRALVAIYDDPDRTIDYLGELQQRNAQLERERTEAHVELHMGRAHREHGKDFEDAYHAMTGLDRNNPDDRATVQRIARSADPGRALMRWHRGESFDAGRSNAPFMAGGRQARRAEPADEIDQIEGELEDNATRAEREVWDSAWD